MSHYFDDILHRYRASLKRRGSGAAASTTSPMSPLVRRSSIARSLAARSDFADSSANGGGPSEYSDDEELSHASRHWTRRNSHPYPADEDPDRARERDEADWKMHQYVADQLRRIQSRDFSEFEEQKDEFEAVV